MTKKEKQFVAMLLRDASDEFSNHGCNDLPEAQENLFTKEEWSDLDTKYHKWNEHTDTPKESYHIGCDWAYMSYFAHILDEEE